MAQGAIFAGIPITAGWSLEPRTLLKSGDWVRVDPRRELIKVIPR